MLPRPAVDLMHRIVALRPALCRRAAFLIGSRTHIASPDDVVQDTMFTALSNMDHFKDESLSGWMTAILVNHIRNAARRAHVRTSVPLSYSEADSEGDADVIDFPVAATQDLRLEVGDVVNALKKLSASDQEIIWLARVDELSHEQIAARLRVPIGTLHSRLSRATARLREVYEASPKVVDLCRSMPAHQAA